MATLTLYIPNIIYVGKTLPLEYTLYKQIFIGNLVAAKKTKHEQLKNYSKPKHIVTRRGCYINIYELHSHFYENT